MLALPVPIKLAFWVPIPAQYKHVSCPAIVHVGLTVEPATATPLIIGNCPGNAEAVGLYSSRVMLRPWCRPCEPT